MQDTPQQEYVWAMGRICDAKSNTWYMDKVEADGRYTIRGAANSVPSPNLPYFDCMREQFKAQPYLGVDQGQEEVGSRTTAIPREASKVDPTPSG
jgi:hypothetical protein